MAASADSLLDRAAGKPLTTILSTGIGGTFFAVFFGVIDSIGALFSVPIKALSAFGRAMEQIVIATFGAPGEFLVAGWRGAIASFQPGGSFYIGPFTPILAMAVFLAVAWMVSQYLELEATSDLIPWSFTDVPLLGTEEN
jgi:hypothetical protein